jgi:hypothetical protein
MARMARGPRIGSTVLRATDQPFPQPIAPHPNKTEIARQREFDFSAFSNCPLIYGNATEIREEFLKDKQAQKKVLKSLKIIRNFTNLYEEKHKQKIKQSSDITVNYCVEFVVYCLSKYKASAAKEIRFCWRLLKTVGVPTDVIPPNPVSELGHKHRKELDEKSARHFLNSAKKEARIIIDRHNQVEEMAQRGKDPRREAGGKNGDWDQLENRLWLCREILGLRTHTGGSLIAQGYRGIIRSMEYRPGAIVIDPRTGPLQQYGLSAHLQFYHPSLADLAPFVGLLMIRTSANLQCVADCQADSSEWSEPFSPAFSHNEAPDRSISIILPKLRGAQRSHRRKRSDGMKKGKVAKAPARIVIPSLKRPWSHPFQVLSFVQKVTAPLRSEVKRRIKELSSKGDTSPEERREIDTLQSMVGDMFLYRTRTSITSLKLATRESEQTPTALVEVFERYGLTAGVRQLRDAGLQFGFRASGHSLRILHLLARHSSRDTAAAYARRQDFFRRSEDLFVQIFDRSVALVRSSKYTIGNLRTELRASGLEEWQITNILNPETRSRYGNRCGGPESPPAPFDNGTPPGQLCRGQDCIDGCPLARFLPDALPYLVKQWHSIKQQIASIGIAAAFENSLQHRLNKVEKILAKYPHLEVLAEKKKFDKEGR